MPSVMLVIIGATPRGQEDTVGFQVRPSRKRTGWARVYLTDSGAWRLSIAPKSRS